MNHRTKTKRAAILGAAHVVSIFSGALLQATGFSAAGQSPGRNAKIPSDMRFAKSKWHRRVEAAGLKGKC